LRVPGSVSILHHHSKGIKFDMTGAILTTAVFALLCSTLATIETFAMARDFPDFELDPDATSFWISDLGMRFMQVPIDDESVLPSIVGALGSPRRVLAYKLLLSFLGESRKA